MYVYKNGGSALAVPADASDRQVVEKMTNTVEQQLGPVNLLVNNAGIGGPFGPFWELDPEEWRRNNEMLKNIAPLRRSVTNH